MMADIASPRGETPNSCGIYVVVVVVVSVVSFGPRMRRCRVTSAPEILSGVVNCCYGGLGVSSLDQVVGTKPVPIAEMSDENQRWAVDKPLLVNY